MSSGQVSIRTKITFSPASPLWAASSVSNTILPTAAPGDAFTPEEIFLASANAFVSKHGNKIWFTE